MTLLSDLLQSFLLVLFLQGLVILLGKILYNNKGKYNFSFSFVSKTTLPHPPSFPLVGNLLQLSYRPLEKLNQWNKKYGPIYGVYLGKKYFIILNNHEVVNDLIVKGGSNYSSRYNFNNSNSVLVKSNLLALTPYGDKWKRDRFVAYSALIPRSVKSYYNYITKDSDQLLRDLLAKHGQSIYPLQMVKKFVLTNMLNVLFGDTNDGNDNFFNDVMKVTDDIAEFSSPMNVMNDFMPILNYVYKPSTRKAERVYKRMEILFSSKYDQFLKDYANDKKLTPCFLTQIQEAINEKENSSIEYEDIWEMLVSLLNGAMETEVNTLMWTIACLANNPGVQEEAFKELDELCDRNKPLLGDDVDLPYINAIINEALRYRPPNPFGFAHVASKDDEYNGCFIPEGTPLLLNLFAINHNERRFIAPDKFRPSRFMQDFSTGSVKTRSILLPQFDYDENDEVNIKKRRSLNVLLKYNSPSLANTSMPMHMSFGAGRRYCIGQHLAQKQLFLAIAYILWAFEIKPGVGEDGETPLEINLDGGKVSLTSYSPNPYKVRFLLRKDVGLLI